MSSKSWVGPENYALFSPEFGSRHIRLRLDRPEYIKRKKTAFIAQGLPIEDVLRHLQLENNLATATTLLWQMMELLDKAKYTSLLDEYLNIAKCATGPRVECYCQSKCLSKQEQRTKAS